MQLWRGTQPHAGQGTVPGKRRCTVEDSHVAQSTAVYCLIIPAAACIMSQLLVSNDKPMRDLEMTTVTSTNPCRQL